MKVRRDVRSAVVVLLLISAVAVAFGAMACSGGGGAPAATDVVAPGGDVPGAGATATTISTQVAVIDPLSSFKSKDPFIAQAQATTTSAGPTTTARITTTTRPATTTTVVHRLTATGFPGDSTVSFTLDGLTLTGFGAGPALFNGGWGTIQIITVNDTTAPFTATFRRNGSIDFTLQVNQFRTW